MKDLKRPTSPVPGLYLAGLAFVIVNAMPHFSLPVHAADELTFERDIRPILKEHCFHCHGEGGHREGGLDVRLRRFLVKGGDSGTVLEPGRSGDSLIVQRIQSGDMPPGDDASKKVRPRQLETLIRWIDAGAVTSRDEPEELTNAGLITDEERSFWAFQPVVRPPVPQVRRSDRVNNPIDAFILAMLEPHGFSIADQADRAALIRRASFDLTGLPPTPEAVEKFMSDESPQAWERLVDDLLASPHYGERWARHWLDVAGYADSEGYTIDDIERKWAWKYRDWVIEAINQDMPIDEFIRQQIAGDEMIATPYAEQSAEDISRLIATGFLRTVPDGTGGSVDDAGLARNEVVAETIKVVSTSLLGLTVGCAQCHDHRYDPIPQSDYYRFRAIFEPGLDWQKWRTPPQRLVSLYTEQNRQDAARIEAEAKEVLDKRTARQTELIEQTFEAELAKLPAEIQEQARAARGTADKERTAEQKALLKEHPSLNVTAASLYLYNKGAADELKDMADQAEKLRATKPVEQFVRAFTEIPGQIPDTFIFERGDHEEPRDKVQPGELTVLSSDGDPSPLADDESLPTTGRRLQWSRWLTSGRHPLLSRVLVNRFWMHHFGRGLVNTPGDFGMLGDRPTHPELLDWLADEFVSGGWSLKRFHRMVMLSSVYQQGRDPKWLSDADATGPDGTAREPQHVVDPDDTLYWQFPMRRIDPETLRDSLLSVSGRLNTKAGGEPVPVMADVVGQFVIGKENLNAGRPGEVISLNGEEFRRTIYIQFRRTRPLTVLETFDLPRMEPNCEKRSASTVATQSLLLMNSEFVFETAALLADRVIQDAGTDRTNQVRRAWQRVFARQPADGELQDALGFMDSQMARFTQHPIKSKHPSGSDWTAERFAVSVMCHMLLSSNEFLYID